MNLSVSFNKSGNNVTSLQIYVTNLLHYLHKIEPEIPKIIFHNQAAGTLILLCSILII